ncbi:hypothetical protein [Lysobacter sp. cf310]|uniref:hypothetical protein n=1 Tax=Lysobacter sp. cf310 TaxID=1761790 RepID=UPI0008EFCFF5|nr:hypothetical protein [Lysobacter sp. cf310]SFK93745.1 hypothetical protein SAMN04487938_2535 [Lysobacter sp. cf310]
MNAAPSFDRTIPHLPARVLLAGALLALLALAWPARVHGGEAADALGSEWIALPPQRLDAMRGGYEVPSGLLLSFGIERAVYVNGELVATTRVNIPDVARMSVEQAQALGAIGDAIVVQIGPGNRFDPAGFNGVAIQNTLDGQDIRSLTTLNVGVNTLGVFQDLNGQAALHNALIGATGAP